MKCIQNFSLLLSKIMSLKMDLLDKYLKPEYLVHHINLDKLDNRLENLYLCKNHSEHNRIHSSLIKLIDELLGVGLMIFDNGKYFLACP